MKCSVYKCDTDISIKQYPYYADINNDKTYQLVCGFHYSDIKERKKHD